MARRRDKKLQQNGARLDFHEIVGTAEGDQAQGRDEIEKFVCRP